MGERAIFRRCGRAFAGRPSFVTALFVSWTPAGTARYFGSHRCSPPAGHACPHGHGSRSFLLGPRMTSDAAVSNATRGCTATPRRRPVPSTAPVESGCETPNQRDPVRRAGGCASPTFSSGRNFPCSADGPAVAVSRLQPCRYRPTRAWLRATNYTGASNVVRVEHFRKRVTRYGWCCFQRATSRGRRYLQQLTSRRAALPAASHQPRGGATSSKSPTAGRRYLQQVTNRGRRYFQRVTSRGWR
ncbi:hypothetical protein ABIA39_005191 [Nocardia sp. GAS34]